MVSRFNLGLALTIALAICAAALAHFLGARADASVMPRENADDLFASLFGDARFAFSQQFERKADEYFHGGVKNVDCDERDDAHHRHDGEPYHADTGGEPDRANSEDEPDYADSEDDHDHHGHAEDRRHPDAEGAHVHEHRHGRDAQDAAFRHPWHWINSHVHAQEHRHIEGADMQEIVPWLWAACKMSPKNIGAYQSAAYAIAAELHMADEAIRLLEDALKNNPDSIAIITDIGAMEYNYKHDPNAAAEWFEKARAIASRTNKESLETQTERDSYERDRLRALSFLAGMTNRAVSSGQLREYLKEAEATAPHHPTTKAIAKILAEQERDE